jgi:hypothetical protein
MNNGQLKNALTTYYKDDVEKANSLTEFLLASRVEKTRESIKMKIPKNKVSSKNVYPFNIFRSKVNDKCLSINNDGLIVEKCNLNNLNQQWSISPNENICLLT